MPANTLDALLDRLAGLMRRFEPGNSLRAQKVLAQLGRRRFPDAASLIRFHEILLFLRAYPHTPAMRRSSEELLASFHKRVTHLRALIQSSLSVVSSQVCQNNATPVNDR
jgi:hypothetical protein